MDLLGFLGLSGKWGSREGSSRLPHVPQERYTPTPLQAVNKLVDRPRLSAWLPYSSYLEDERVFVNGESLGFVLESVPQTGADEEMANILHAMITACPAGTGIQICLLASPDIRPTIRHYGALRVADPDNAVDPLGRPGRSHNIHRATARRRGSHYLRGARTSLVEGFPYLLRRHRLVFSFAIPGKPEDMGRLEQLLTLREGMRATLGAAGFDSRIWQADDLVNWVAGLLNPERLAAESDALPLHYDPAEDLRGQMVALDTVTQVGKEALRLQKVDGSYPTDVRFLSVSNYPREFSLWRAGGLAGDLFQVALQYPCPYMITLGIHVPDQTPVKTRATANAARAVQMADSDMGRLMPDWAEKRDDWQAVMKAVGRGEFVVQMYHQIALFTEPGGGHAAEHSARAIWRAHGFDLVNDTLMQVQALLACLPLSLTKGFAADLSQMKRIKTLLSTNAIHTAPLVAEWTGTGTPALLFGGRRGSVMAIDFMDNTEGNFNVAISGTSGSGKSVLMNEITAAFLGMGRLVRICDKGGSYLNLCELLGGQYLDFTDDSNLCINPFSYVDDLDEDMQFLKPLFIQMIAPSGLTSLGTPISDFEKSHIEIAIRAVWEKHGLHSHVTHVAEHLKTACSDGEGKCDPRIRDLGVMLTPFTAEGMHGKWFHGQANVDLGNDLVVLELLSLDGKKDLQSVVLFTLTFRVAKEMKANRGLRKGLFLLDEAWDLLGGGMATDFVEAGSRTARKYDWSFGTATQGLDDYYKTPGAQAALDNADWVMLGRQKPESIEKLSSAGRLVLNDHMKRMLTSLRKVDGQYSEWFIKAPAGHAVGRLLLDPFSLLLYSSKGTDYGMLQRLKASGLTVEEAINRVLAEKRGGQR